ncbi:MAG: hypothetical protein NZ929_00350 [Aigarchaeota archaeon]|nr:hypothetical protein [Aigarchaeota archaeon]
MRTSIQYSFSKQRNPPAWAEVRGATLITSGATVTSATVAWYRETPSPHGFYFTVTVTLRDEYGNPISSGSATYCYSGYGEVISSINLSSDVSIDKIARVEASISIGSRC